MAFATASDVAARLGRALTDAEETQAESALTALDGLIRDAVDRDADWTPDPVPAAFKELSIQKAISVVVNPHNVAAHTKSLGAASRSETFPRAQDLGLFLSEAEGRALRSALWGSSSGSSSPRGVMDRINDLREGRDVDEDPPVVVP